MNNTQKQFSETEDTTLKQFLSGSRVWAMLAAAIMSIIVFIPTFAAILGIYSNASKAKNVKELSEINLGSDLDGQYVTGSAYKFLTKLGYIAETEAAATEMEDVVINGMEAVSYVLEESDTACVSFVTEAGFIFEVSGSPKSDENFAALLSMVMASIQAE